MARVVMKNVGAADLAYTAHHQTMGAVHSMNNQLGRSGHFQEAAIAHHWSEAQRPGRASQVSKRLDMSRHGKLAEARKKKMFN